MQRRIYCQRLIFGIRVLILGLVVAGQLWGWTLSPAQANNALQTDEETTPAPVETPESSADNETVGLDAAPQMPEDEDHSGQSCGECHLDYDVSWQTGVHAIAYDRASFQDAWVETNNDPECLACHTTDFRPATGEFHETNVTCRACHGATPADHPPATFVVNTAADTCGDCHTTTFSEWEHSLHAFAEDMGAVGCATCHNPHGQTLRFDSVNDMCLNCHTEDGSTTNYIHLTHNEVDFEGVDVTCSSCHMYNNLHDELHELADHTMAVATVPCTDCHEQIAELGISPIIVDVDTALAEERDELRVQVIALEEQLVLAEESPEADQPLNFVQLTQGLVVGLGLGVTLVVVLRRNGTNNHS